MFACFVVSEPTSSTIYSTLALQYLCDGIPVSVIIFDAVFPHPCRYDDVIPLGDIADGVEVFPQLHIKSIAYARMKHDGGTLGQIVVGPDVLVLETRQQNLNLSFLWSGLRNETLQLRLRC